MLRLFAAGVVAAGLAVSISGCSGAGSETGVVPSKSDAVFRAAVAHRKTWMNQPAPKQDLLYVSDSGNNAVNVYAYPTGTLVGQIVNQGEPTGLCSDSAGDVWLVDTSISKVVQYAHGGKQLLASLSVMGAADLLGCAVDPVSGSLAVTDLGGPSASGGVWLFNNKTGTPTQYQASYLAAAYFASYDASGNLFVDGVDQNYDFVLAELPSGGKSLEQITLNQSVGFPGGVKWDGSYLVIGDQAYQHKRASAIYQVTISGSGGMVEATTPIASCDMLGFDIATQGSDHGLVPHDQIIAPDGCKNDAAFFNYPSGSGPTITLSGLQYPVSAVVSLADRRQPPRGR